MSPTSSLSSKNKIKVYAKSAHFHSKGHTMRSTDNFVKISVNGKVIYIDDIDIYTGPQPYIKIYGDVELVND